MGYFNRLPNFNYVSRLDEKVSSSDYIEVKNIFKRAKIREDFFQNFTAFTRYTINGDERPDNVAQKFFKDPDLDWIVLYINNIINVREEWPLTNQSFKNHLVDKYGSLEGAYAIHHYETEEVRDQANNIVVPAGLQVDENFTITYRDVAMGKEVIASDITDGITNEQFETNLQNEKRQIYILRPAFLGIVLDDIERVMTYSQSSQYINDKLKKASNINIG